MHIQSRHLLKLHTIVMVCILFFVCPFSKALSADPNSSKTDQSSLTAPQQFMAGYNQLLKQISETHRNSSSVQNFINNQGKIDNNQVNKMMDSFPIKNQQINQSAGFFKGFVYDPNHPGPFFDSLITLQNMSLNIQGALISAGEKTVGAKNSYVIGMKANYERTVKYLDALKQQKILVEQTTPSLHR